MLYSDCSLEINNNMKNYNFHINNISFIIINTEEKKENETLQNYVFILSSYSLYCIYIYIYMCMYS